MSHLHVEVASSLAPTVRNSFFPIVAIVNYYEIIGFSARPQCFVGYNHLTKLRRNLKFLEFRLGEGFFGSRGDAAFRLRLG